MCIRLHLHRIPCDTRPFLTLAKPSPQGKLCLRYINPYSDPVRCAHRITASSSCPWNGCCTHTSADLPCDCADSDRADIAVWGKAGPGEDISRCLHFREYHEYEFREGSKECAREGEEGEEPAWQNWRYLDEWLTVDDDLHPEFYCQSGKWDAMVKELIQSGEELWGVVRVSDIHQGALNIGGVMDGKVLRRLEGELDVAWGKQREIQKRLRAADPKRAEALLGFAVGEEVEQVTPVSAASYPGTGFI